MKIFKIYEYYASKVMYVVVDDWKFFKNIFDMIFIPSNDLEIINFKNVCK